MNPPSIQTTQHYVIKTHYVIELEGVHKEFRRGNSHRTYTTLKGSLVSVWKHFFRKKKTLVEPPRPTKAALSSLTLRVPHGSSVGVIGRNGSGKSTLLKVITGIYRPTGGKVVVQGKLAALIELGAGFHPDFTGRENVILGGIMHGLTRAQVESRMGDIITFAELEDAIDAPVRTYSSGMFMRLGFSLAVHTNPDILLIDEVLAVGDAAFVAKCKEKIADFRRQGKTLLVVSHDLDSIGRWCDEVVWLEKGQVKDRGEPRRVIDAYLQFIEKREDDSVNETYKREDHLPLTSEPITHPEQIVAESPKEPKRWGGREVEITSVTVRDREGNNHHVFHPYDEIHLLIQYKCNQPVTDVVFGVGLTRSDGVMVFGTNTHLQGITIAPLLKEGTFKIQFSHIELLEGIFSVDIAAHRADGYPYDYRCGVNEIRIRGGIPHQGISCLTHQWELGSPLLLTPDASKEVLHA